MLSGVGRADTTPYRYVPGADHAQDMCCGGPLTAPGAPTDRAYLLYSPSSQGRPPLSNCSGITPALRSTNFNGIATAAVSLTKLLASRFVESGGE